jgi:putative transposase
MSRYRLQPAAEQESALLGHCSDARYIWNLAVERHAWWRPGRTSAPGYLEQSRQLTAARAASPWLAEGSQTVQQQALRDFDQAVRSFFAGTHRRPTWRRAGQHAGFRVVAVRPGDVRRLSRHRAEVKVPKVADVNAARNIAAGHAVKARGGDGISRPVNREPQLTPLAS